MSTVRTTKVESRKDRHNGNRSFIYLAASLVVLVLVLLLIFSWLARKSNDVNESSKVTGTPASSTTFTKKQKVLGVNPILDGFPKAPKVKDSRTTVVIDDRGVQAFPGFTLTYREGFFRPFTTDDCTLTKAEEFCLIGRDGSAKPQFNVIFLKDAAHSRLFENPSNFKREIVKGAETAGSLDIETGGRSNRGLVIVSSDSSGWLILSRGEKLDIPRLTKELSVTKRTQEFTN